MGIGVPDVESSGDGTGKCSGVNVKIFEEATEAPLMTKYTGGKVHSRTATLALSMDGGGGFGDSAIHFKRYESKFHHKLGDYGTFACKIKSRDVKFDISKYEE